MPATYEPIATTTLVSSQSTVTFSSISQNYTDLIIVATGTSGPSSTSGPRCIFNGDTGANYSNTVLYTDGTGGAGSSQSTNQSILLFGYAVGWSGSNENNFIVQIMNYSNTGVFKTLLSRVNAATATYPGVDATVGLYNSLSAITSITLSIGIGTDDYQSGTTFTLFGIKAA